MAHFLDAHRDFRSHVDFWRRSGQMIPLVHDGQFQGFVNRSKIGSCPAPNPLPVADFILGMEAMGHRFDIAREHEGGPEKLILNRNIEDEPESWQQRANELIRAFGQGRGDEGIAYLRGRG